MSFISNNNEENKCVDKYESYNKSNFAAVPKLFVTSNISLNEVNLSDTN